MEKIYGCVEDVQGVPSSLENLFCDFEDDGITEEIADETEPLRYAWLENEDGFWCFLTTPFADPAEARRYWKNEEKALAELQEEGWQILHAYPRDPRMGPDCCIYGYGLHRSIH